MSIQADKEQDENVSKDKAATYDLLYITRAYNNREITFDEWMKQSKEWAESIIEQYGNDKGKAS